MEPADRYYLKILTAFIRGKLSDKLTNPLLEKDIDDLNPGETEQLYQAGKSEGLKLHKFKKFIELPRVKKVLGILKGLRPDNLLDIGSGRGVFLWSLLDNFPCLDITCIDILKRRVDDINALHKGGISRLRAYEQDATNIGFADSSFEVVTALEVLEHIPDYKKALSEIVRVAEKYIILSVPSKEDDNPEHINLFTREDILKLAEEQNAGNVHIEFILNHMIIKIRK